MEKKVLNKNLIGKEYPAITLKVKKNILIAFSKSIDQADPVYFDKDIAREKGHRNILAPPTFLTVINMHQENPYEYLENINVSLSSVLHAGQEYSYFYPIYAGDEIEMKYKIEDVFHRKNRQITFIAFKAKYSNQDGIIVAESTSTLAIR